jgi:hypothetical protein
MIHAENILGNKSLLVMMKAMLVKMHIMAGSHFSMSV